jgi:branched-chain amino acid transport system substrate-binding protein
MSYSVVFRIIGGSFEEGYEIEAEIRHNRRIICTELGRLPPQPEIPKLYEQTFPTHYANWGGRSQWGAGTIDDGDAVEAVKACVDTSKQLEQIFQTWFRQADLEDIQTRIVREIPHGSEPIFILEAPRNLTLQRLPWHKWNWLNKQYPNTEIVLSRKAFAVTSVQKRLRILVILGSEESIDLKSDWDALETNIKPIAQLDLLPQPRFDELCNKISQGYYNIIFFAGHSGSQNSGDDGWIKINDNRITTIKELTPELRDAIGNGLKMVFLNSCNGLGIASRLSNLEVPYIVVMREPIHNDVAGKFIEHCLEHLAQGNSLTRSVSQSRNKLRSLEDKYICASWMPIIFQSREAPDYIPFPKNNSWKIWRKLLHTSLFSPQLSIKFIGRKTVKVPPIVFLVIGLATVFFVPKIYESVVGKPDIAESIGDRSLFAQSFSPAKAEGIKAFGRKDYDRAIEQFTISLRSQPNDPETRIYLNNALALQQSKTPEKLPIIPVISSASNGYSTAIEVLSGAGIAQMDINQQGGIKSHKILLKIVLDQNDENLAKKIAQKLVKEDIKGVVGHIDSNTSVAVAPIYNDAGLVMISPTSSTMDLKYSGKYIFRTAPNSEMMAKSLADYVSIVTKKKKLGFCFDSSLTAGKTFRDAFISDISHQGGSIVAVKCDLSDPQFSPQSIVQNMVTQGADGLVIYYHLNQVSQFQAAKDLARSAQNLRLPLFGSHSLVASDILESGRDFEGMVVVTPRHPDLPFASTFSRTFRQIFGLQPNWREMTSYDAVKSIAVGLQQSDGTRAGLQQKLHDPKFTIPDGSSGPIKFSQSGDRLVTPSIAQVQCQASQCKFGLIPPVAPKLTPTP